MKTKLRLLIMLAAALAVAGDVRAANEEEESLGKKFKDFFTRTPSPTPAPARKKKSKKKATPSPSPTAVPKRKAPRPQSTATPAAEPSETVSPEPSETPRPRPTPAMTPLISPSPSATPATSATPTPTASPLAQKKRTAPVAISSAEVSGYDNLSPEIRKVLDLAFGLTTQNLGYKYGSADPANGGMDCSGFIHYVLSKSGMTDVPRDAREQYIWVRKAGNFQAVLGHSEDTFELDALKPGDLLFWAGTYNVDRDPAITHTMIYLGREKGTNQRIMVGASDGRTYKGQSRFGVSVFDFKVSGRRGSTDDKPGPVFVGYGRIPGLSNR